MMRLRKVRILTASETLARCYAIKMEMDTKEGWMEKEEGERNLALWNSLESSGACTARMTLCTRQSRFGAGGLG